MEISELQKITHNIASSKGWHEQERTVEMFIANCHRELSEALECYVCSTDNKSLTNVLWVRGKNDTLKPEGYGIELADVILRILDEAELRGINMTECLSIKTEYNKTRGYRHGNKRI